MHNAYAKSEMCPSRFSLPSFDPYVPKTNRVPTAEWIFVAQLITGEVVKPISGAMRAWLKQLIRRRTVVEANSVAPQRPPRPLRRYL